jgi:hypothetical protein
MSPRSLRVDWMVGVGLLLVTGLVWGVLGERGYDDPYITFRYAANLRAGLGFVYNPGLHVQSTTAPLYALALAGLGGLWGDLPQLSNAVSVLSLALGGYCLYRLGIHAKAPLAGAVSAFLYATFPLLWSTLGAETCLYLMLLLASLVAFAKGRTGWAFGLAAAATLTRPDGILMGGVLALTYLFRRRRAPWRSLALYAGLVLPWFLFAWVYFGSPLPATLAAKQHQGQMTISDSFLQGLARTLVTYSQQWQYWLWLLPGLIGLVSLARRGRRWWPLLLWSGLYVVAYAALGVSRYFWYYAPLVPAVTVAVGVGSAAGVEQVRTRVGLSPWVLRTLAVAGLGLLFWPNLSTLAWMRHHPDARLGIYREVGQWLAAHTPAGASVGALEVGIIGYYSQRPMIDFAGLIQPKVAARWALAYFEPDYVVVGRGWFPHLEEDRAFQEACWLLQRFVHPSFQGELELYRCVWETEDSGIRPPQQRATIPFFTIE